MPASNLHRDASLPLSFYILPDVYTPDADIDTLLMAPKHCHKHDFFGSWCELLALRQDVSEMHPIPDAYTPVLKFNVRDTITTIIYFVVLLVLLFYRASITWIHN